MGVVNDMRIKANAIESTVPKVSRSNYIVEVFFSQKIKGENKIDIQRRIVLAVIDAERAGILIRKADAGEKTPESYWRDVGWYLSIANKEGRIDFPFNKNVRRTLGQVREDCELFRRALRKKL